MTAFRFYEMEGKAYIYDINQERLFEMGCEASLDVPEELSARVLKEGMEIDKDQAWKVSGLDKLDQA